MLIKIQVTGLEMQEPQTTWDNQLTLERKRGSREVTGLCHRLDS